MSDRTKTRREGLSIEAVNPLDGKACVVQISHQRLQAVCTRSMGAAKEAAHVVPQVLQRPTAVFEGLCEDADEDRRGVGWRCYVGVPDSSFRRDGTAARPYPGEVFLVFVNDEGVAYNWRWEKCDGDDPKLPQKYAERFKRRLL